MNVLLVEDEELYADQVEMLVHKLGHEVVGISDNSTDALDLLAESDVDLILMDVHIRGDHDGIELASMIKAKWNIPTIFITSLRDDLTFKRANRAGAANFIVKPFDKLQLQRAIELACDQIGSKHEPDNDIIDSDTIYIKEKGQLTKVALADIYYLEADGHYTYIYTEQKRFIVRRSIVELSLQLSPDDFIQTHRSYMVKRSKITSINLNEQTVDVLGTAIPISKRKKAEVITALGKIIE